MILVLPRRRCPRPRPRRRRGGRRRRRRAKPCSGRLCLLIRRRCVERVCACKTLSQTFERRSNVIDASRIQLLPNKW